MASNFCQSASLEARIFAASVVIPSKMHIPVLPLLPMPAQVCTFVGCFGLWTENSIIELVHIYNCTDCCILYMYMYILYVLIRVYLCFGLGSSPCFLQAKRQCKLNCCFVGPYHVFKVNANILSWPGNLLLFICICDQLAAHAATVRPSKGLPASKDSAERERSLSRSVCGVAGPP